MGEVDCICGGRLCTGSRPSVRSEKQNPTRGTTFFAKYYGSRGKNLDELI